MALSTKLIALGESMFDDISKVIPLDRAACTKALTGEASIKNLDYDFCFVAPPGRASDLRPAHLCAGIRHEKGKSQHLDFPVFFFASMTCDEEIVRHLAEVIQAGDGDRILLAGGLQLSLDGKLRQFDPPEARRYKPKELPIVWRLIEWFPVTHDTSLLLKEKALQHLAELFPGLPERAKLPVFPLPDSGQAFS